MTTEFSRLAAKSEEELRLDTEAFVTKFDANVDYAQECGERIMRCIKRCGDKGADPVLFLLANLGFRTIVLAQMQRLIDAENEANPTDDEPTLAKIQAAVSSAIADMKHDQDEFESKIRHELDGIKAKVNRMEASQCSA